MRHRRWVFWSGVLLVVCGLLTALRIPYFYVRNHVVSQKLLAGVSYLTTADNSVASQNGSNEVGTTDLLGDLGKDRKIVLAPASVEVSPVIPLAAASQGGVLGVLDVPKLNLQAPILEGTDDAVLNVAVGHLEGSAAPGQPGVSVLSAHNATWFRHIDGLKDGDQIDVKTESGTFIYRVTGHSVVRTTDTVPSSAKPLLILEACYPLDALYLTPERYLVDAQLVKSIQATTLVTADKVTTPTSSPLFTASVPRDLQNEGLLLHENNLPLGTLTYTGMDSAFTQSQLPLGVTNGMVQLVEAFLHASADENTADLSALFPSLSQTHASIDDRLFGVSTKALRFTTPLNLHITGHGQTVTQVTAQVGIQVADYVFTMTLSASASVQASNPNVTVLTLGGVGWK